MFLEVVIRSIPRVHHTFACRRHRQG